jgi:hypothetical protein
LFTQKCLPLRMLIYQPTLTRSYIIHVFKSSSPNHTSQPSILHTVGLQHTSLKYKGLLRDVCVSCGFLFDIFYWMSFTFLLPVLAASITVRPICGLYLLYVHTGRRHI